MLVNYLLLGALTYCLIQNKYEAFARSKEFTSSAIDVLMSQLFGNICYGKHKFPKVYLFFVCLVGWPAIMFRFIQKS